MYEDVPLISLEFYLSMMHLMEEDYMGVSDIERYTLFHRRNAHNSTSPVDLRQKTKSKSRNASEITGSTSTVTDSKAAAAVAGGGGGEPSSAADAKRGVSIIEAKDSRDSRDSKDGDTSTGTSTGTRMNGDESKGGGGGGEGNDGSGRSGNGGGSASLSKMNARSTAPLSAAQIKDVEEAHKPYGPYDMESIDKRVWISLEEQYDQSTPEMRAKNGIQVPFLPLNKVSLGYRGYISIA